MITVNVKQLRLGEDYYQIPYSVIKTLDIKEDLPFIVKDFNDDKEIGCFIVREITFKCVREITHFRFADINSVVLPQGIYTYGSSDK